MPEKNVSQKFIRNFSIIAHIDHGKSTLADRLIELGELVDERTKKDQILDSMDIERERGITIKSNSASFWVKGEDQNEYLFNLIDTPGHVDFSYEVFRSLAACEGVLLLVDAAQGVQAQTLANFYLALEADLMIVPVINKIDLPSADLEKVKTQIRDTLGLDESSAVLVSAKNGLGLQELLQEIIKQIPPPKDADPLAPLRALVFDAYFDAYRGVVAKIRIFEGTLKKNDSVRFLRKDKDYLANEVGFMQIKLSPREKLLAGEVGYLVTGIKNVSDIMLGDTLTTVSNAATEPLIAYKEIKPMVFSGLYPVNSEDYEALKDAIEKLSLNDAALVYEPESSEALGFGYRVGYLGLLHMEIVQERLEREFGLYLITTAPSVKYRVHTHKEILEVDNPSKFPDVGSIEYIEEPYSKVSIITPKEYLGNILKLLQDKRGESINLTYLDTQTVQVIYLVPLAEMIFEFYDRLKSVSRGYAGLDYEVSDYKKSDLVKLDILVHHNKVDALSMIVHPTNAEHIGRKIIASLKHLISRHQFQIALQAAVGSRIVARENISALKKNVTAKCYGGDISRKRKLLEKQKEGKKRMKMIGSVEVPQEAFLAVLRSDQVEKKDD